jgi:alpha-tubulin suppressor-like RCC1 family protein
LVLVGVIGALLVAPALASAAPTVSAYSWGWNAYGQLGTGSFTSSSVPVPVANGAIPAGVTITQSAMGGYNTVALGSDGNLYTWGYGGVGELGNGATNSSNVPVAVSAGAIPAGTTFKQVAAGAYNDIALTTTGTVYSWGYGPYGGLGNGTTGMALTPVAVTLPAGTTVTQIAAGADENLALTSTGQVLAWGYNGDGELGNGTRTNASVPTPVSAGAMPAGTVITQIASGGYDGMALSQAGAVYTWGYNSNGQLGNGTTVSSLTPVAMSAGAIPAGSTITQIAGGGLHSLVLTSTGNVYTFGSNSNGQLGNGTTTDSSVPVAVSAGAMPAGTTISKIAGGFVHSAALSSTGNVYTWGDNAYGELGNGLSANSSVPVAASLPAGMGGSGLAPGPAAHSATEVTVVSTSTTTTVNGNVPSTLSLSVANVTPILGPFTAGVAATYSTTLAATVTSSASSATLSANDGCTPVAPETTTCYPGYLVNNTASGAPYPLAQPLQVGATSANSDNYTPPAGTSTGLQVLTNAATTPPYSAALLNYADPVSADAVTITFQQMIGAGDPLRTGTYTKTITFTLSTTHP